MKSKVRISADDKIVVLTGAGISAESGLRTFRDHNGLWDQYKIEEVATPQAFSNNPELVWEFYKLRYDQLGQVFPNPGHLALVELELRIKDNFTLITQNVDGLHGIAGNKNILEIHGSLREIICINCRTKFKFTEIDMGGKIPLCLKCGGNLRPDVVWFGEIPYYLDKIDALLSTADYFLVVGTSGSVYPAAQFLQISKQYGAYTVGVNFDKPDNLVYLDEFHQGKSGEILPQLIDIWLGEHE